MRQPTTLTKLFSTASIAAALAGGSLVAGDYGKAVVDDKMPIEADPWSLCDIFDYNTLYEGDSGFVKSVEFHGRYHGNYVSQQEDVGGVLNNGFHNWYHRRARLGIEIEMEGNLKFYAETNIADNLQLTRQEFINDFQDIYIEWEPTDGTFIRVGKQKQNFTLEDRESSKRIKTLERSHIVNETAGARPWGIVAGFETGAFTHEIGGWIYGADDDAPEWVDFRGNGGFHYNLFFDVNDSTTLHFDYLYNDNNSGLTGTAGSAPNGIGAAYEHAIAAGIEIEQGRFQLISDIIYAANRTANGPIPAGNDTWGLYILPSYDITDNFELVAKYAYMDEGRNQHTQRFGDTGGAARQRVQNYHTFFLGAQYFICGEKLKLMGGYEWASGELFGTNTSIDSGSWQLGVRTYW